MEDKLTIGYWKRVLCQQESLNAVDFYVVSNGKKVTEDGLLSDDLSYMLCPRLLGGKGGFGSMLRMIGAQIEKTTNHEACRDLSGRRMRDINNEKKLKDWVSKESDREQEKDRKKKERIERMKRQPKHKFEDKQYFEQRTKVTENLQDAITEGIAKAARPSASASATITRADLKRKSSTQGPGTSKKSCEWFGVDIDPDDISSDSDSDDDSSKDDTPDSSSKINSDGPSTSQANPGIIPLESGSSSAGTHSSESDTDDSNQSDTAPIQRSDRQSTDGDKTVDTDNNSRTEKADYC